MNKISQITLALAAVASFSLPAMAQTAADTDGTSNMNTQAEPGSVAPKSVGKHGHRRKGKGSATARAASDAGTNDAGRVGSGG